MTHRADRDDRKIGFAATRNGGRHRRTWLIGAALLFGAAAIASATGNPSPAQIAQFIHARHDHFHALGKSVKSLREQIGRADPDWNRIATDANQIERLAAALPTWFPQGSGPGHGIKTKARARIWAQPQAFAVAAKNLSTRAQDLAQAVGSHDPRALRQRARSLGQACGSCHHRFRAHSSWW